MKNVIILTAVIGLAACSTNGQTTTTVPNSTTATISDADKSKIATCGAGLSSSTLAKIEASISLAKKSGKADAGVEEDIRAAILSDRSFKSDNIKLKAYDKFLACIG